MRSGIFMCIANIVRRI